MSETESGVKFTVNKEIPIAVILTVVGQLLYGIWAFSDMYSQIGFLKAEVQKSTNYAERLVRVETQLDAIKELLINLTREISKQR